MSRTITDHIVDPSIDNIVINVVDAPGAGGASHRYDLTGFELVDNPSAGFGESEFSKNQVRNICNKTIILFQNGPLKEAKRNGITQEALIAICIDRLRSFQKGDFSCRENAIALTHLEDALMWLQKRTRDRLLRGVEGTNKK